MTGQQESTRYSVEEVGQLIDVFKEKFGASAETVFMEVVTITFLVPPSPTVLESLWPPSR